MRSASSYRLAALVSAVIVVSGTTGFVAGCGGSRGIDTKMLSDGTTTRTLSNSEIKLEGAEKYYGSDERSRVIEKQCFLDYRSREKASGDTTYEIVFDLHGCRGAGHRARPLARVRGGSQFVRADRRRPGEETKGSDGEVIHGDAGLSRFRRASDQSVRGGERAGDHQRTWWRGERVLR